MIIYFRYGYKVERSDMENVSKKKMGRPKVDNPRLNRLEVKLNDDEYKLLLHLSEKYKMDKSELVRYALSKLKK